MSAGPSQSSGGGGVGGILAFLKPAFCRSNRRSVYYADEVTDEDEWKSEALEMFAALQASALMNVNFEEYERAIRWETNGRSGRYVNCGRFSSMRGIIELETCGMSPPAIGKYIRLYNELEYDTKTKKWKTCLVKPIVDVIPAASAVHWHAGRTASESKEPTTFIARSFAALKLQRSVRGGEREQREGVEQPVENDVSSVDSGPFWRTPWPQTPSLDGEVRTPRLEEGTRKEEAKETTAPVHGATSITGVRRGLWWR